MILDRKALLDKTLSNPSFQSKMRAGLPNRPNEKYETGSNDSRMGVKTKGASTLVLGTMHGIH